MLDGIDGVLNLAAAAGSNLATTSDIVTDALTGMGYTAKDAGRLADVMAAASSNANTNVEMMGQTFKYAAPIVGAMGYNMEDTAVAIGLMANSGIKAEQAGTSLRSILTRLAAPPKAAGEAMTALGISITDSEGNMKSLNEVMVDLREAFDGLSESEQAAYAKDIAGANAMSGLLAIVNAAPEDFDKLTKAIDNADGTAERMAKTMQDNLQGQITILKSALEGLGIRIYDELKTPLTETAKEAITAVDKISNAFTNGGVQGAAAQLGDILATALSEMAVTASQVGNVALDFIEGFTTGISNNILKIDVSAKQIVQSLIDGVIATLPLMADSASELIGVAAVCIDRFVDGIKQNSTRIGNAAKDIVKALANGIVTILPKQLQEPVTKAMEKIEKSFNSGGLKKALTTFGTGIKNTGTTALNVASKMLSPLVTIVDKLADKVDVIIPLIAAWAGAYKAMSIVKTITTLISGITAATTAESIATAASTGTLTLKQVAVAALTGKITLATAAQHAWNLVMNANPLGILLTAVTALAAGIGALKLITDNQTEADKELEASQERLDLQTQRYNDNLEIFADTLSNIFDKSNDFNSAISSAGSCLEGFNGSVEMSTEKQQELSDKMSEIQTEITEIARHAAEERGGLTQTEIDRLEELFAKEKELADQQLKVKQEYQNVVKDMAEDLVANEGITVEEYEAYAQQYINTAQTTRDEAIRVAQEYKTNYLAERRALIGTKKQYTEEWYNDERKQAEQDYQENIDNANKICADTLQIISDGYLDKSKALSDYVTKMSGYKEKEAQIQKDYNEREIQLNKEEKEAINKAYEDYAKDSTANEKMLNEKLEEISKEYSKKHSDSLEQAATERSNLISDMNAATCDEVVQDNLSAWLAMEANTELYGSKMTSKGKVVADTFLKSFSYLDDDMKEQSRQAMEGMMQGLEEKEPALYAKADNIANNIIYRLRSAFDIHSPSRVTRKIFTQVIEGGEVGVEKEAPKLYKSADETAETFSDRLKSSLSAEDLVTRMQNAVYSNNRSLYNAASARVEHIINRENSSNQQNSNGVVAKGNIVNHINFDGREVAIMLTPYISEEMAFT